jgi:hypothetical protein
MRNNGGHGAEPRPSADETRPPHALAEPLLDASAAAQLLSVRPSWIYEAVRASRIRT